MRRGSDGVGGPKGGDGVVHRRPSQTLQAPPTMLPARRLSVADVFQKSEKECARCGEMKRQMAAMEQRCKTLEERVRGLARVALMPPEHDRNGSSTAAAPTAGSAPFVGDVESRPNDEDMGECVSSLVCLLALAAALCGSHAACCVGARQGPAGPVCR